LNNIDWNKHDRLPLTAEGLLFNFLGLFFGLIKDAEVRTDINVLCETLQQRISDRQRHGVKKRTSVGNDERRFIACHKNHYLMFTDLEYPYGINADDFALIKNVTSKLHERGVTVDEYLDWVFGVFMKDTFNAKQPPTIKRVCSHRVLATFVTQNKGRVLRKKREQQQQDRSYRLQELGKRMFRATGNTEIERVLEMFKRGDINTNDFEEQLVNLQAQLGLQQESVSD